MAAWTSCSATSMASERLNVSVMTEAPGRARRGHLVQPRHLAELFLQRRGDRRSHHLGAGARIERLHLDGRIGDFRQRRQRQLQIGDHAHGQDRHHQQSGGDRPEDEEARRVHCGCGATDSVVAVALCRDAGRSAFAGARACARCPGAAVVGCCGVLAGSRRMRRPAAGRRPR